MNTFENKVVVITGGTSGIGLGTANAFAGQGAAVFITGRNQARLEAAVQSIKGDVTGVRCDSSKLEDLDHLYDVVQQKHSHIDVLFANAGLGDLVPLGAITEEHYKKTFDTNVKGTLFTVQKALPLLKDGASIILTSSTTGTAGTANFSVYSATKAAIRNFARSWILDLKDRGIRVNVVSPGLTETAGVNELFGGGEQAEAVKNIFVENIPSNRTGQPQDIANAVMFLASDNSSFINGIELFVDGGMNQI